MTTSLGSRKNMCINPKVNSLSSLARINDKCLDLNKSKSCPYNTNTDAFADATLSNVRDIEDLVQLGKKTKSCPYYGTRRAIKSAELVLLPYNLLLLKSSRDSLGIDLNGHIVIIDEAHNLIDAISQIYSVSLDVASICRAQGELVRYFEKYKDRLSGKNVEYIRELLLVLHNLQKQVPPKMYAVYEFVKWIGLEHVNLFKLDRYLTTSRICQKLHGFIDSTTGEEGEFVAKHTSSLGLVHQFIHSLSQIDEDGRVISSTTENVTTYKYLLLNPAPVFGEIVEKARSVVLAGGTMEPIVDFRGLFPSRDIMTFQCGHVIPPDALATYSLGVGPSGVVFDFTFENRHNVELLDEVGKTVSNLCNIVPGGLVVFFPSYAYMESTIERWKTTSQFTKLTKKKEIFIEPRSTTHLESALRLYAETIQRKKGAVLLSVVGGKMSEGINFTDDMGRCVLVVGMPFANLTSLELREKMEYLEKGRRGAGQIYYENLCMRAVNQSIGRAIRHCGDYATIVLLDARYDRERIRGKIPAWIREGMKTCKTFGMLINGVGSFFRARRSQASSTSGLLQLE